MPNHALISDFFALNITLVMSVVLTHMRKQVVHSALLNYDIVPVVPSKSWWPRFPGSPAEAVSIFFQLLSVGREDVCSSGPPP